MLIPSATAAYERQVPNAFAQNKYAVAVELDK
jgi:hypothetical protein